jgi:hypothetical protein
VTVDVLANVLKAAVSRTHAQLTPAPGRGIRFVVDERASSRLIAAVVAAIR